MWIPSSYQFDAFFGMGHDEVGMACDEVGKETFHDSVTLLVWLFVVQYPYDFSSAELKEDEEDGSYDRL